MSLQKFVNSLFLTEEADDFFENDLRRDLWFDASPDIRKRALMTVSEIFNGFSWVGTVLDDEQPMAFPRDGLYFDTSRGKLVAFKPNDLPNKLYTAGYELALHFIVNPDVLQEAASVRSIKIGPIYLDNVKGLPVIPDSIFSKLRPFLRNGGNAWWRAN